MAEAYSEDEVEEIRATGHLNPEWGAMRVRLLATVDQLRARAEKAEAECEELRKDRLVAEQYHVEAATERDRMREALEEIADTCENCYQDARNALGKDGAP